jgi:hypothetical protein
MAKSMIGGSERGMPIFIAKDAEFSVEEHRRRPVEILT